VDYIYLVQERERERERDRERMEGTCEYGIKNSSFANMWTT
jgi:hypothetical protein